MQNIQDVVMSDICSHFLNDSPALLLAMNHYILSFSIANRFGLGLCLNELNQYRFTNNLLESNVIEKESTTIFGYLNIDMLVC